MQNKKNTDSLDKKAKKAEMTQKQITRIVCLFLAALMVMGGTIGILLTVLMS